MITANPLTEVLAIPLGPDWTVDQLAENVLATVAERSEAESEELVIDAEVITDRQTLRLLRPLIACLATKSATEAGTSPNLYGGSIAFNRPGPEGPVWIFGQFENTPEAVKLTFRRMPCSVQHLDVLTGQQVVGSPTFG
jgi:hypothetical protein